MGSGVATPRWPPGHRAGSSVWWAPGLARGRERERARLGAACGADLGVGAAGRIVERYRAIRTARLHALLHFHLRPIDVLV